MRIVAGTDSHRDGPVIDLEERGERQRWLVNRGGWLYSGRDLERDHLLLAARNKRQRFACRGDLPSGGRAESELGVVDLGQRDYFEIDRLRLSGGEHQRGLEDLNGSGRNHGDRLDGFATLAIHVAIHDGALKGDVCSANF